MQYFLRFKETFCSRKAEIAETRSELKRLLHDYLRLQLEVNMTEETNIILRVT